VGILDQGRPALGAIALPAIGETVWTDGASVYRNGARLTPRPPVPLDHPLAFLAGPSNLHQRYDVDLPRVRSLGSTAAHALYVAEGIATAALLRRVSLWDLAGVLPILERMERSAGYLSGAPFDAGVLLEGALTSEPLVIAHRSQIEAIRNRIRPRLRT
jgi:fructose-1,6-bisphosphatase/inositol monophosphatase family enzyme